jgi:hypothetical protein
MCHFVLRTLFCRRLVVLLLLYVSRRFVFLVRGVAVWFSSACPGHELPAYVCTSGIQLFLFGPLAVSLSLEVIAFSSIHRLTAPLMGSVSRHGA